MFFEKKTRFIKNEKKYKNSQRKKKQINLFNRE